jgi:UDP-2,4-diacetamido-2,4,6-trideoxy-beta-L-altropyranose hydrolase
MQNRLIAIRLDFGPKFGLGHLTRCIILADFLKKKNIRVIFISKFFVRNAQKWIGKYEIFFLNDLYDENFEKWTQKLDAQLTLKALSQFQKVDWVIVDNYELDLCWEQTVAIKYKVAAIEDLRNRKHAASVIISESPTEFSSKLISNFENTRLLAGPKFSIIAKKPVKRNINHTKLDYMQVLITYGASDLTNESIKALQLVVDWKKSIALKLKIKVALVIGPHYSNPKGLQSECNKAGVQVYKSPADIKQILKRSDVVLTTGGNTMVEALNYCCITIVTKTEKNQIPLVEHLNKKGLIFDMGFYDEVSNNAMIGHLTYASENMYRFSDYLLKNNPFDGCGCARIYNELFL